MSGAPKKDHAPKPDQIEYYQQEKLLEIDYQRVPEQDRMGQTPEFRPGNFIWPAKPKNLEYPDRPNTIRRRCIFLRAHRGRSYP